MADSYNELFGLGTHLEDATLEGYWKLQETTGTAVVDSSSNGRDGSHTKSPDPDTTDGPTGWLPSAFDFSTSGWATHLPGNTRISWNSEWTMLTWFRLPGQTGSSPLFHEGFTGGMTPSVGLEVSGNPGGAAYVSGGVTTDHDTGSSALIGTTDITDNTWRLGSLVRNAGGLSVAVNGVEEGTAAYPAGSLNNVDNCSLGAAFQWFFPPNYGEAQQAGAAAFGRDLSAAELGEVHDGPEPLNVVAPTLTIDGTSWTGTVGTWDAQSNGMATHAWELRDASDDSVVESGVGSSPSGSGSYEGDYYLWVRASNAGLYDAAQDASSVSQTVVGAPIEVISAGPLSRIPGRAISRTLSRTLSQA